MLLLYSGCLAEVR